MKNVAGNKLNFHFIVGNISFQVKHIVGKIMFAQTHGERKDKKKFIINNFG